MIWDYVEDSIYYTNVTDTDELNARIRNAMTTVDVCIVTRTWQEMGYQLDILRVPKEE